MKTAQEAAREYAHDHIKLRCKDKRCEEADCRPLDRNVSGYHTKCRVRYQEYRDGFLDGARWAEEWISVKDEWPKDEDLILAKDPDGYIDLMQGWQLKERIKPYAVDDFYTAWRPIERKTIDSGREPK